MGFEETNNREDEHDVRLMLLTAPVIVIIPVKKHVTVRIAETNFAVFPERGMIGRRGLLNVKKRSISRGGCTGVVKERI